MGSTVGTRLAIRVGTKAVVTAGLALQALFYVWVAADIAPTLSYAIIAVQMVLYGLGMGLTSARDRIDHGGGRGSSGGDRIRRQRIHPPARRNPRRGRHRQRLFLAVRLTARRLPPATLPPPLTNLALAASDRVLDLGSGFGGPARQIARRTAHHVVGIDLTPAYVEAAQALTAKTGLSEVAAQLPESAPPRRPAP
ncbi:methyltransferase domain-containing protein [Actinoallomurus sp. CA-142502]|uniref:SAM-dependent methyltransferase n=1 Tax=Actinoallomurus sp. CA-142502 TaxID=3239885 RepID=UPI003D8F7C9D